MSESKQAASHLVPSVQCDTFNKIIYWYYHLERYTETQTYTDMLDWWDFEIFQSKNYFNTSRAFQFLVLYTLFFTKFYKNEAQIWPKIKNNLRIIEAQLHMENMTASRYMRRFIAGISVVRNIEWAEKKIKTVPHVFYDSAELYVRQK